MTAAGRELGRRITGTCSTKIVRLFTGSRGRMTVRDEDEVERLGRGVTLRLLPVVDKVVEDRPGVDRDPPDLTVTPERELLLLVLEPVLRGEMGARFCR